MIIKIVLLQLLEFIPMLFYSATLEHMLKTHNLCFISCLLTILYHQDRLLQNKGLLMLLYYQEGLLSTLCSYLLNKSLFTGVLLGFFCSIIQQHNTLESVLTYSAFFMNTVLIASMISFLMSSHIPQAMLSFLSILLICPFLFILLSYMNNQARWTECYFLWGSWMILFPISVVLIQSLLSISFEYFE